MITLGVKSMLIEFTIKNFRSINEKVTLSMVASPDKTLQMNTIHTNQIKDRLLRSAILYGANASGKTNILYSLAVLRNYLLLSHQYGKHAELPFSPFLPSNTKTIKPTEFYLTFFQKNIRYEYCLSFNKKKIIEELLYYYPKGKRATIFERRKTNEYKFTVDKGAQKSIAAKTRENVSYLSSSVQWNYPGTEEAFNWFENQLYPLGQTDHPEATRKTVSMLNSKNNKIRNEIMHCMEMADLGIVDIDAKYKKLTQEDFSPDTHPEVIKLLLEQEQAETLEARMFHRQIQKGGKEKVYPIDYNLESEGTKKLFSIIGPCLHSLANGRILILDELDVRLHPLLCIYIIKLFHNPNKNKSNAQLLFSTHNTNFLDLELFRRDQIWFTEKNPKTNNTELYSLVDFSPRKDSNIQKGYLMGRYGAIPFIREDGIC